MYSPLKDHNGYLINEIDRIIQCTLGRITTDIRHLTIHKQQSTQFYHETEFKQTNKILNDGWSIKLNTKNEDK